MYNLQGMLFNHLKSLGALTSRLWSQTTIRDSTRLLLPWSTVMLKSSRRHALVSFQVSKADPLGRL